MKNFLIKLWNKIFGNTIFGIWLDKKSNKKKTPMGSKKYYPTKDITIIDLDHETNPLDVDLVDDNISETDKKELRQYTKMLVTKITNFSIIWISWSYVLASYAVFKYGEFNPLESLSETVGTALLGVVITYGFKALLETFLKKKNEKDILFKQMDNDLMEYNNNNNNEELYQEDDEEGTVG